MFTDAILGTYRDNAALVGLCDLNQTRMAYHNRRFREQFGTGPVPTYDAADFPRMIAEQKPDVVIVTSVDRTHHHYIIQAMELGCDVITEKPMTTDAEKCEAICQAIRRTGRTLRVTFNYRYSPARTKIKALLASKVIGDVKSVHFEWLLDTRHGADYFRRWHRDKENSGGLAVHKSTHHFDLVNWWLDSVPEMVYGLGSLAFYGRSNAQDRGISSHYARGTSQEAQGDPFAFNLRDGADLEHLYLNAEHEDGYMRDQNVFGEGITTEDTLSLLVRYRNGAQLSYSLCAYSPWEGYRIAFNGTKGRLEFEEFEVSHVNAVDGTIGEKPGFSQRAIVHPHWEKPYEVDLPAAAGAHSGGDALLLEDLFGAGNQPDPYRRQAGHLDGAYSILTGIAANRSFETGQPTYIKDLLGGLNGQTSSAMPRTSAED